jgi:hypothetical protein
MSLVPHLTRARAVSLRKVIAMAAALGYASDIRAIGAALDWPPAELQEAHA